MKCPNCGQWNQASFTRCFKCGQDLTGLTPEEPSWRAQLKDDKPKEYIRVTEEGEVESAPDARDQLAREMADLKTRKDAGAKHQRRLRMDASKRGSAPSGMTIRTATNVDSFWNVDDDPTSTVRIVGAEKRDADATGSQRREAALPLYDGYGETRSNTTLWSQEEMSATYQIPRDTRLTKLPSRSRGLRRMVRVLVILLVLALAALGVYFVFQVIRQRQATVNEANQAIVTASIKDDLAAHTILIPGNDGEQIYIRELHTSYLVTGGFATVEVEDHTWYDDYEGTLGETMSVSLTPFVKTASGSQTPMDPINYDISIPLSPITIDTPDSTYATVATAMYSMSLTVRPGSKLTINGDDYTDVVDADTGSATVNLTVQPIGDNVFTIVVRSQYCRENTATVTLYRAVQEIPLDLAADTYSSTNLKQLQISCTTLPGATVDVLSSHSDLDVTNLDINGSFTFYAVFDKIGYNTISVTASFPGKKTSTLEYTIYYVPTAFDYTKKAWGLGNGGYAELLNNIKVRAANSQVYLAAGTIQYIISSKPQMAVIDTGEDGTEQLVTVENYSKTTWKVGEWYRLYGDVYGSYDAMPWLQVRYTYSLGEQ